MFFEKVSVYFEQKVIVFVWFLVIFIIIIIKLITIPPLIIVIIIIFTIMINWSVILYYALKCCFWHPKKRPPCLLPCGQYSFKKTVSADAFPWCEIFSFDFWKPTLQWKYHSQSVGATKTFFSLLVVLISPEMIFPDTVPWNNINHTLVTTCSSNIVVACWLLQAVF